ncbi:hypothetical protein PCE1_004299 [Barthelona sp. PCE]
MHGSNALNNRFLRVNLTLLIFLSLLFTVSLTHITYKDLHMPDLDASLMDPNMGTVSGLTTVKSFTFKTCARISGRIIAPEGMKTSLYNIHLEDDVVIEGDLTMDNTRFFFNNHSLTVTGKLTMDTVTSVDAGIVTADSMYLTELEHFGMGEFFTNDLFMTDSKVGNFGFIKAKSCSISSVKSAHLMCEKIVYIQDTTSIFPISDSTFNLTITQLSDDSSFCDNVDVIGKQATNFHVFYDMNCDITYSGGNLTIHEGVYVQKIQGTGGNINTKKETRIGTLDAEEMTVYVEGSLIVDSAIKCHLYASSSYANVTLGDITYSSSTVLDISIDLLTIKTATIFSTSVSINAHTVHIDELILIGSDSSVETVILQGMGTLAIRNISQISPAHLHIRTQYFEADTLVTSVKILRFLAQTVKIGFFSTAGDVQLKEGRFVFDHVQVVEKAAYLTLYDVSVHVGLLEAKKSATISLDDDAFLHILVAKSIALITIAPNTIKSTIYIDALDDDQGGAGYTISPPASSNRGTILLGKSIDPADIYYLDSIYRVAYYDDVFGKCLEDAENDMFIAFPGSICEFSDIEQMLVSFPTSTTYLSSNLETFKISGIGSVVLRGDDTDTVNFGSITQTLPHFILTGAFTGSVYVTSERIMLFSKLHVFDLHSLGGVTDVHIFLVYKGEAPHVHIDSTSLVIIRYIPFFDSSSANPLVSVKDDVLIVFRIWNNIPSQISSGGCRFHIEYHGEQDDSSEEAVIIFALGTGSSILESCDSSPGITTTVVPLIRMDINANCNIQLRPTNPSLISLGPETHTTISVEQSHCRARIVVPDGTSLTVTENGRSIYLVGGTLTLTKAIYGGLLNIFSGGHLVMDGDGGKANGMISTEPYSSLTIVDNNMIQMSVFPPTTHIHLVRLCPSETCYQNRIASNIISNGYSTVLRTITLNDVHVNFDTQIINPMFMYIYAFDSTTSFKVASSHKYFGHLITNVAFDKYRIQADSFVLIDFISSVELNVATMGVITIYDGTFTVIRKIPDCCMNGTVRFIPRPEHALTHTPPSVLEVTYFVISEGLRMEYSADDQIDYITDGGVLVQTGLSDNFTESYSIVDDGVYELLPAETSIDVPNYFNGTVYHDASHKLEVHVGHNVTLRLDGKTNQPVEIHVSGGTLHLALTVHKILKFVGSPDELILSGNATLTTSLLAMDPVLSCLVPSYFFVSASSDITVICEYGSVSVIATGDISITATLSLRHASFEGELADVTIQEAVEGAIGHVKSINLLTGGIVLSHPTTYITRHVHTGEVAIDCAIDHCSVVFPEESIFDGFVLASPEPSGVSIHVMDSKMYSTTVDCIVNATGETMLNGNFGSKIFAYKSIHLNSTTIKSLFLMPGSRATGVITATNVVMLPTSRWNSINGNVLYLVNSPSALWSCGTCDVVYGNRYQLPFKFKAMSDLDVSFSMNDVMEENPVAIPPHVNSITVGEEFSDDKMTKDRVLFEDAPAYTSTPTIHTGDTFTHVFYRNFELKETVTETNTHVFAYDVIVNSLIIRNTSSVRLAYRVDGDLVLDNSFAFLDTDVTITGSITCNDCKIYMNAHTLRVESGVVLSAYTDESPEKGCGIVNGTLVTSSLVLNSDTSTRIVRASIETDSFIHMGDAIVETGAFIKTDSLSINGGWTSGAIVVNREFTIDDSIITQKELAANSTLSFESKAFTSGDFEHICELFTRVRIMGDIRITANFNCLRVVLRDAPNVDIIVKHARVYGRAGSIRVEEDGYLILPDLETHFTKLSIAGQFDLVSFTPHLTMLSIGTLSVETDCMTMFVHALSVDTLQIHNITVELRTLNLNVVNIESSSGKLISLAPMRTLRTVTDSSLEIEVPTQTTDLTITNSTVEFTDITHFTGSTAFVDSTVGLRSVSDIDDAFRIDNSRVLVGNAVSYTTCVFSTGSTITINNCLSPAILIEGFSLTEINGNLRYDSSQNQFTPTIGSTFIDSLLVVRLINLIDTTTLAVDASISVFLVNEYTSGFVTTTEPDTVLSIAITNPLHLRQTDEKPFQIAIRSLFMSFISSPGVNFILSDVSVSGSTDSIVIVSAGDLTITDDNMFKSIGVFSGSTDVLHQDIETFSLGLHSLLFGGFKASLDLQLSTKLSGEVIILRLNEVQNGFVLDSTSKIDISVFSMDYGSTSVSFSYIDGIMGDQNIRGNVVRETLTSSTNQVDAYMFIPNTDSISTAPFAFIYQKTEIRCTNSDGALVYVDGVSIRPELKNSTILCSSNCDIIEENADYEAIVFLFFKDNI